MMAFAQCAIERRWLLVTGISFALLTASCSLKRADTELQPVAAQPLPQLAQVGFGRQAEFRQCTAPLCPRCTPKTLSRPMAPTPPVSPCGSPAPQEANSDQELVVDHTGHVICPPNPSSTR
jgi:hypothetical protein